MELIVFSIAGALVLVFIHLGTYVAEQLVK